jgi:hypothetical protein
VRLGHRFIASLSIAVVILGSPSALLSAASAAAPSDVSTTKLEVKKFRFGGRHKKHSERLVVEFIEKEVGKNKPTLKIVPNSSGKEATLYIDQATLVGAIPEALINDSYVSRSKYLGPVSINTEGGGTGFSVRTFLKQAVTLDAYLLEHPMRLVLDVSPLDAAVTQEDLVSAAERNVASVPQSTNSGKKSRKATLTDENGNKIVCYPASKQVIATVDFYSPANIARASQLDAAKLANLETVLASGQKSVETAICFPADSQLSPNITYQPKINEAVTYVQPEAGGFGQKPSFSAQNSPISFAAPATIPLPTPAPLAPVGPAAAPAPAFGAPPAVRSLGSAPPAPKTGPALAAPGGLGLPPTAANKSAAKPNLLGAGASTLPPLK